MKLPNQKGFSSFVVLTIFLLLIIGGGLFFYKSSAYPITQKQNLSSPSGELNCDTDGYIWDVNSQQVPGVSAAELEQIKSAFYKEACNHPVKLQNNQKISYEGLKLSGDWAIAGSVVQNKDGQMVSGEGSTVIFHKTNNGWIAAMPNSKQYSDLLDQLPEELISKESKQMLK